MRNFYMVWNSQGNRPRKQYPLTPEGLKEAHEEAERVAIKHPGADVHVLSSVGFYQTPNPAPVVVEWHPEFETTEPAGFEVSIPKELAIA